MHSKDSWFAVARNQLFTARDPNGELGHYLRGLDGDRDAVARLTANTYEAIRHYLTFEDPDLDISWGATGELIGPDRTPVEVWEHEVTAAPSGEPRCFLFVSNADGAGEAIFAEDEPAAA